MLNQRFFIRYALLEIILFIVFAGVQYLKGQSIDYSIKFGLIWSIVASTLYLIIVFTRCQRCKANSFLDPK
jgi:hypothetical protein